MMAVHSGDLPLPGRSGEILEPVVSDGIDNTLLPSHSPNTAEYSAGLHKSDQDEQADRQDCESERTQEQCNERAQDAGSNEDGSNQGLENTERKDLKLEFAEPDAPLAVEQLKFCAALVRNLKRLKDARPFIEPVDPVKLNIPTYFDIVKNPMDLSLIESNLKFSKYPTAKEFMDDVLLIFDNCYLFNGESDTVSACAKSVEASFLKQMAKIPTRMPPPKKKTGSNEHSASEPCPKHKKSSAQRVKSQHETNATVFKVCHKILKEIHKKQYSSWNTPFLYPVNPVALDIPEYYSVITHPIDLSTIRKKLDDGEYSDFSEFVKDFKLMFSNCYKFNAPGSHVYNSGKKLEEVFFEKVDSYMPLLYTSHPPSKMPFRQHRGSRSMYPVVDYSSSDDEEDASLRMKEAQQFKLLLQQIQVLNSQIEMLKEKRFGLTKKPTSPTYPTVYSEFWQQPNSEDFKSYQRPRKHHRGVNATKQQIKKHKKMSSRSKQATTPPCEEEPPLLTYDQKAELSNLVNNDLSSEALQKVMELIKSAPGVSSSFPDQDEIELDIEQMDRTTLWKLYQFVKNPNDNHEDHSIPLCDGNDTNDRCGISRNHRQPRKDRPSSNMADATQIWNDQDVSMHSSATQVHGSQGSDSKSKDGKSSTRNRAGNPWSRNSASSSSSDYTSDTDYDDYSDAENIRDA